MSNININDITNNSKVRHYPYSKVIKTPEEMIPDTEYDSHIKNIKNYVYFLLKGEGPASKVNNNYKGNNLDSEINPNFLYKPLGFNYFLLTGTKCKDVDSNKDVERALYINNIVSKKPIGLIDGNKKSISNINENSLYNSFKKEIESKCKLISLETKTKAIDNFTYKSGYLTIADIKNIDPCLIENKKNPITNKGCLLTEGYKNYISKENYQLYESDYILQLRNLNFILLILLFSYVLIRK